MFNIVKKNVELPDGRIISLETGKLARQADGAVLVTCGETILLATVVSSKQVKDGIDFLPLSVDYIERYAAAGKVPGGFLKRDGKMGEHEVLTARLVDRALRPMFPDGYHADTQVMVSLLSSDKSEQADSYAGLAASAAIMVSDIPFPEPISEVRVAKIGDEYKINPLMEDMNEAVLDLMVAGTNDSVVMVEGEMKEVSEEVMVEAIQAAHEAIKKLNNAQAELAAEVNKPKREFTPPELDEELLEKVSAFAEEKVKEIVHSQPKKKERSDALSTLKDELMESLKDEEGNLDDKVAFEAGKYFGKLLKKHVRKMILEEGVRLDKRNHEEVRPISCEVGVLPRAHGSGLFTRGETQSLTSLTLGTKMDEQIIDRATFEGSKKFMLQYIFPGFSTGDVKPNRAPSRREVGHGNLAERALKMVLADEQQYTIRLVSDILESNGSSSMATVCAGTLALMDAGVKIEQPVSGIAMGLITDEETGKYAVLSDIMGDEDHVGDMDFKVTGTVNGLTACQMDIKIKGLPYEILIKALHQAKDGRSHILNKMLETIGETREELSKYAPRMEKFTIPTDTIGAVIGPGGKIIQEIQKLTETVIIIEEVDNKGVVTITATDQKSMEEAKAMVKNYASVPEVGEVYTGKVKAVKEYGAFVEFLPGKEGLLHISEISHKRLESLEGVLEVGEEFPIKLVGIDKKSGKFRLSRKVLLPKE